VLEANRRRTAATSIITLGEFPGGFADPRALVEFLAPFRVVTLSRPIASRTAVLQTSLSRRFGEDEAWIAGTALSHEATLIGRVKAFWTREGVCHLGTMPARRRGFARRLVRVGICR
jgi:predicted nucleic acid-binding protein